MSSNPFDSQTEDWKAAIREDLTIIIPSFRCAAYLPTAVNSALHSPAARILIADDGSGPAGLRTARELEEANPGRVRVLASPVTRGVATNMNEAVEQVETRFFAKLDGDDVLLPGYLETVFPTIATHPRLAILAGRDLRIGVDEAIGFQPELLPTVRRRPPVKVMRGAQAYEFIVHWNPNPTSSGVIYRTDAFREVGGYDRTIHWGEDWEIWLRFARLWDVGFVDGPAALYRIHSDSATATATRNNRLCYGYDAVFRRAAELCDDPNVMPLIRRRMLGVAKLYVGAAARQFRRSARESLESCLGAGRAVAMTFAGSGRRRSGLHEAPAAAPARLIE